MTDRLDRSAAKLDEWAVSAPSEMGATAQPRPPGLAESPAIMDLFKDAVQLHGVVGETALAATVYLALTSRVQDSPVSIAVKGPSSSGKSWTIEKTAEFFPREAVLEFTSVSEKALIHTQESFKHRTLIFYEVTGLRESAEDNLTSYFVRTLLSEGKLVYESTAGTPGNFYTERIEKEGPTNLIFTTTKTKVHPENETRCMSLNTDDSPEQTKAILQRLAREDSAVVDLRPWLQLQRWLQIEAETRVTIPFAEELANLIPPVAVRLRRDFLAVLALIRAHAVLHQLTRDRNDQGSIVATLEDYDVVRDLVADVVSEGVDATVSPSVRETVEAVVALGETLVGKESGEDGVPAAAVAQSLKIDKSNAGRRLRRAADGGYVRNLETRRFRPGRWVVGDPIPEEVDVLPATATLARTLETRAVNGDSGGGCEVALESGQADVEHREEGEV